VEPEVEDPEGKKIWKKVRRSRFLCMEMANEGLTSSRENELFIHLRVRKQNDQTTPGKNSGFGKERRRRVS